MDIHSCCLNCVCFGCPRLKIKKETRGNCTHCESCHGTPFEGNCKWREEYERKDNSATAYNTQ